MRPSTQQSRVTVFGNGSALVTSADSFWVFQMAKQQFRKQTMNEKINAVVLLLSWPLSMTANANPPPPPSTIKTEHCLLMWPNGAQRRGARLSAPRNSLKKGPIPEILVQLWCWSIFARCSLPPFASAKACLSQSGTAGLGSVIEIKYELLMFG